MDNSFDKFNNEFTDKKTGGVKYAFYVFFTFLFDLIAAGFGVYAMQNNQYIALLTLVFGLFGTQTVYKAKGTDAWNKLTRVGFIISMVMVVFAAVVLYILPMFS